MGWKPPLVWITSTKVADSGLGRRGGWQRGNGKYSVCVQYVRGYPEHDRKYTVSILGLDSGYTVKYSPPPEGVPEGKARGNSRLRPAINQALRICLELSWEAIYFLTHQFKLIHHKIIIKKKINSLLVKSLRIFFQKTFSYFCWLWRFWPSTNLFFRFI